MSAFLAFRRLAAVTAHLARGLRLAAVRMPGLDDAAREAVVRAWSRESLQRLGVALHCDGSLPPGAILVVANHVSWLDIPALLAVAPRTRFVSKAAVGRWPVVGTLARAGRTLFIERERKRDALRVVHEVAGALGAAEAVAVFPEGTTGPGAPPLPFHANLLQAAISTGCPIQPVVLRYSQPEQPFSPAAQYVGDTTLLGSLWRIAGARGLAVHLQFLPIEPPGELDRRALAERLRTRIGAALPGGCG